MYADKQTEAMRKAIDETDRRRAIQVAYNLEHGITPETIVKGISDITEFLMGEGKVPKSRRRRREKRVDMKPHEIESTIVELEEEMLAAAEELRFEYAAKLRDEIRELRRELDEAAATRRRACFVTAGRWFVPAVSSVARLAVTLHQPDSADTVTRAAMTERAYRRDRARRPATAVRDRRRTTGIYCRPSCPARTRCAQRRFYATADEARAAGYRACRRCRP